MSNFEVQQQHQSGMNHTTWHESVTNLAEMNNFWRFGQNVIQYPSALRTYIMITFKFIAKIFI